MPRTLHVHLLPELVEPAALEGGVAVVIDVLRATTNIAWALDHGASRIIPCLEVDEARAVAARLNSKEVLLGGERAGRRIDGFHLGNSPAEYGAGAVAGRTIVFTTTNGTKALARARQARRVATAAFANVNAVLQWLRDRTEPIHLLCAGTDGKVTLEDTLCAGVLTGGLWQHVPGLERASNDAARLAWNLSEPQARNYDSLMTILRGSRGGKNLIELGLDADLAAAARWDACDLVPELSRDPWQITPATDARPLRKRLVEPPAQSRRPD